MSQDRHSSRELFSKIIRIWGARPDPSDPLTFKQVAALTLGSGTSENASIIGRTVVDFKDYFRGEDTYRWSVRWTKVKQDHPDLYPRAAGTASTVPHGDPLDDMLTALRDEVAAVKKQSYEHPIKATVFRSLGQIPDGGFWYEAQLDLPGDTELPIPEGVQIKLRWPYRLGVYPCEARLLSHDALKMMIIFEVEQPLGETQIKNECDVLPCVEKLIEAVALQLARARQRGEPTIWGLLQGRSTRKTLPWNGAIVLDKLDPTQIAAVQSCLEHDLTFLWGPPGTGKTHTLGRLMASVALEGRRVVAAAISNIAVDQMALHVVRALEAAGEDGRRLLNEGRIIRFGHPRDPDVTADSRLFPNKTRIQELRRQLHDLQQRLRDLPDAATEDRAMLQHFIHDVGSQLKTLTKDLIAESRVVLTTAVQTCIEQALYESTFDFAVIDEASMMSIPYVLCVGSLSADRVVIAGDFRQLGPISLAQTAAAHRWLHKDPFEIAGIEGERPQHPSLVMLQVQRRMHNKICSLINKPFYGGKLKTDAQPRQSTNYGPIPGEPAVFIVYSSDDGSKVEQTVSGSRVNRKSAELVVELVCKYLCFDDSAIVGVIAPYRAQVTCIRRLLRERSLSKAQMNRVRIGTVHAFQGSEADVVVWDLVETRDHKIGRLYHKDSGDRLTNVAISRAQGKLVLVGDPEAFFLAPGKESVGKIRQVIAAHFHENSVKRIRAKDCL